MRKRATVRVVGLALLASAWGVAPACGGTTTQSGHTDSRGSGGEPGAGGTSAGRAGAPVVPHVDPSICGGGVSVEPCVELSQPGEMRRRPVLLVVDQSGSMSDVPQGFAPTKWAALETAVSTALVERQGVFSFGLQLFPTSATDPATDPIPVLCGDVDRCCEMPTHAALNVPVQEGIASVPQIVEALVGGSPAGGTPTTAALARAHEYFTVGDGAGRADDAYVLLITDGRPNCSPEFLEHCPCYEDPYFVPGCLSDDPLPCCIASTPGCLDDPFTLERIEALASAGVATIVFGLPGTEPYADLFQEFADAGGFVRPDGTTEYYATAASGGVQELTDTLRDILAALSPRCVLATPEGLIDLERVNVVVECIDVPRGSPEGDGDRWYYDRSEAPGTIVLDGPVCERLRFGDVGRIDVLQGCPSQWTSD